MGIKATFKLKKTTQYSFITLVQPSLDTGNSLKWILGIFQDGASLVTHSQILSTFQDGGRVKVPIPGIVVDVKIPTHVHFTKSNSNDRCIKHFNLFFKPVKTKVRILPVSSFVHTALHLIRSFHWNLYYPGSQK